jgi:hypothetical protein
MSKNLKYPYKETDKLVNFIQKHIRRASPVPSLQKFLTFIQNLFHNNLPYFFFKKSLNIQVKDK